MFFLLLLETDNLIQMSVSRKKRYKYHTANCQSWKRLDKVDMALSTEQSMDDLAL